MGPRLEAPEDTWARSSGSASSAPVAAAPAAEGRPWKYSSPVKVWPMSDDPTTSPSRSTSEPSALSPKASWAIPVTASG